jgi:hypothetical protein
VLLLLLLLLVLVMRRRCCGRWLLWRGDELGGFGAESAALFHDGL